MPAGAVALALGAAVLHAIWNLFLARAPDTQAATAVVLALCVAMFALPAALLWQVEVGAWPYIAASAAFELGYVVTLGAGLSRGDLSVVYPLARGSAPVLVLAVSAGLLGAATSTRQVTGVALVAGGVMLVRGLRRPSDPRVVALALSCGACIAGYTVVDAPRARPRGGASLPVDRDGALRRRLRSAHGPHAGHAGARGRRSARRRSARRCCSSAPI